MADIPTDRRTHEWLTERFWRDDEPLLAARERFAELGGPLIEVPNETGALLATLIRASGARRVLEVGTLFGYSAVWMARALPADGTVDTLELLDAHADQAEQLLRETGLAERVTVHRGSAADTLATLTGPYDLAFIDADKERYPDYLEHALRLVRPGGLIIADNVIWSGRVADPGEHEPGTEALRTYLERARAHPQLDTNVLPVGDGVAVSVRSMA
jgi:predicted O-methyltransferase YrrM